MFDMKPDPGQLCENCGTHPGTVCYVGDGGTMGFIHGAFAWWCKCCTLKAQIKHCEEAAERLPELRKELETACRTQPASV